MAAPALPAPHSASDESAAIQPIVDLVPEANEETHLGTVPGRFPWERQLRSAVISRTMKGFLLYLGTFMDNNGRNCRPSSRTVGNDWNIGRQRVFELFSEAEESGWIRTEKRPGKPSERLPTVPTRQTPPDGSEAAESTPDPSTRQGPPDGSENGTRLLAPDYTRQARADPTGTEQEEMGRPAPSPRGPKQPQAVTWPDRIDPLTAVPDLNDTKQVTSQTRTRNETVQSPLMTVISNECQECGTILDPDGACFRCATWGTHETRNR